MLILTEAATVAIAEIMQAHELDEGGLRIAVEKPANGHEPTFSLAVVTGPDATDQVVEAGEARVFVEAAATDWADDKVLDAVPLPEGAEFTFAPAGGTPG